MMKLTRRLTGLIFGGVIPLLMLGNVSGAIIGGTVTGGPALNLGATFQLLGPQVAVGGQNVPTNGSYDLFGMDENPSVVLGADLVTATGTILAGTGVSSHLVFFDPASLSGIQGTVSFATKVLGIIISTPQLTATNGMFGLAGTTYLNNQEWGLENGYTWLGAPGLTEGVSISGMNEITFTGIGVNPDYVRVLTSTVPEPGSLGLLTLGAVGFISAVRRRTRKAQAVELRS